jgi:hypothetical protein
VVLAALDWGTVPVSACGMSLVLVQGSEPLGKLYTGCLSAKVMMELVYGVVLGCWLGLRLGWDYYIGAFLEMYHKLKPWYLALVVSVPNTCTNYRVILPFTGSNQTSYLRGVQ